MVTLVEFTERPSELRGRLHARLASRPADAVATRHAHPSRFDGPPRVVCLGYQFHDVPRQPVPG